MAKEAIDAHAYAVVEHQTRDKHVYQIERSRSGALLASLVHIVPVAVTFGILQLSFRNYYFADADATNQRVKLSALQIAAKVHEILILVSLSSMVLHYTRKLMVSPGGISFGLLEAAYQSGLSSNPWTIGNWQALKHLKDRLKSEDASTESDYPEKFRAWHLVTLLFIFAFLALFIGPASAITLLPQLGWWQRGNLFGFSHNLNYARSVPSVYIPKNMFPMEVDKSLLPALFCDDAAKDANSTCPSARIAEIRRSFTIPLPNIYAGASKVQNTSLALSEDDAIQRRMMFLQIDKRAAAMVPNYVLASFASLIKTPSYDNWGNLESRTPFTLELFANGAVPLSPLVGVNCSDTTSDLYMRDYIYELDSYERMTTLEDVRKSATIDIRSIWSEDELSKTVDEVQLAWKDVTGITTTPVMLALLRHEQNVTVCSIQSYWTPTSQWVLSTSNYDVATNFTFQMESNWGYGAFGYPYSLNAHKVYIHEDWVETLNAVNGSNKVLHDLLTYGINTTREAALISARNTTQSVLEVAYPYFEATISQILAKTIADGLSRIGAEYAADHFNRVYSLKEITVCDENTQWCSQGPWFPYPSLPLAVVVNSTYEEAPETQGYSLTEHESDPILRSFPKPADADKQWTHISLPIRNYGYAYTFSGITMYLSVALLCFHAAIVLAHVLYRVVFDCQTFDFGESLGNLLVLALGDRAPVVGNLWSKRMAVVPFGTVVEAKKFRLEVVETETECVDMLNNEQDMHQYKTRHVDHEDAVILGSTMWSETRESRYPFAGIRRE
jgi:hypothetical protein